MSTSLTVFLAASVVFALTPGPSVIFLVTRTLSQGRKAGLASVAGVAIGNFGSAVFASFGLAVILSASATAFLVVKLAGAAYLVFLGLRTLFSAAAAPSAARARPLSQGRSFRDGLLVALLNPKTALFYAAFLPQFIDPAGSPLTQTMLLGGAFICIALCTDALYVLAAGTVGPGISSLLVARRYGRYVTGSTFIALGAYVALGGMHRQHALE